MGSSAKTYLVTLLLYVSVVNEITFPAVSCEEEESQCLPRKTFFALLRMPEANSNLAAYSRTGRIIQDAKNRNEIVHMKASSSEDSEDAEICLPVSVYLDLFSDPAMRRHLSAVGRAQRLFEDPRSRGYLDEDLVEAEDDLDEAKRSIATLAKNGDLPITIQDKSQEEDEEEKRSLASLSADGSLKRDELEALLRELYNDAEKRNVAALARDFALPPNGKRNVASLARDFALPPTSGKRNIAALARDFALPSGKRNIAALARNYAFPYDKRNVAALARDYALPASGKRNIAALARDYSLPSGKRYLDMFTRNGLLRAQGYDQVLKRNFASLVRTGNLPVSYKRNVGSLARDWNLPTQNRYGRSLDRLEGQESARMVTRREDRDSEIQRKEHEDADEQKLLAMAKSAQISTAVAKERKNEAPKKMTSEKRPKRQIDYNDEYPLPVMQNTNVLDYEELIEALAAEYPNTEKRFMAGDLGRQSEDNEDDDEELYSAPPVKRHIAALARLGWLPSFRSTRFSRSPRYLLNRENSANGTPTNDPSDTPARTLGLGRRFHSGPSDSFGDCRHGFKRYLLVQPSTTF